MSAGIRRIGILGGTFDPPHVGHLTLAAHSADQFNLEKVYWLLTPTPPHKTGDEISPMHVRKLWVESTIAGNPIFELSTVDIDREPPHYALDSIRIFKHQFPSSEIYYLIGSDSMMDLQDWYLPEELITIVDQVVVYHRIDESTDFSRQYSLFSELKDKTRILDTPIIGISSTLIRNRIRHGKSIRYLVSDRIHDDVIQYSRKYKT